MPRRILLRAAGLAALCILSINLLVRVLGGGDPNLLSPRYLPEKTHALAALAWHGLGHLLGHEHPEPRAAVRAAARAHRVPERLALAVARAESSLDPHAISRTGAMGLMQLMPGTARAMDVADPFDSRDNARGGSRYLRTLLDRYDGALPRAVAAYNAGPGRVPRTGTRPLPPETRHYVRAVLGP